MRINVTKKWKNSPFVLYLIMEGGVNTYSNIWFKYQKPISWYYIIKEGNDMNTIINDLEVYFETLSQPERTLLHNIISTVSFSINVAYTKNLLGILKSVDLNTPALVQTYIESHGGSPSWGPLKTALSSDIFFADKYEAVIDAIETTYCRVAA